MHVRRALLLFAIVLGLAAVAGSISTPSEERGSDEPPPAQPATPRASPGPGGQPAAELRFTAGGRRESRRLEAGRPATVLVEVQEPGQVTLHGETRTANPGTPARFELLIGEPQRLEVRFSPARRDEGELVGTVEVRP